MLETDPITVRRAGAEDAGEMLRLFVNTVHRVNRRDYSQPQVDAWASPEITVDAWAQRQQTRRVFVAEKNGQIVGFAELETNGHLDGFYCHHAFQRQGIGTALLRRVIEAATVLRIPCLFADVSITARPFFERQGFVVVAAQNVVRHGVTFLNYRMTSGKESGDCFLQSGSL